MSNIFAIDKRTAKTKAIITAAAVFCAVALPQIFHAIGVISGWGGSAAGAAFLPMHIPVLLAGFLAGPAAGLLAGIVSPLISYAISGMPTAALLPFILAELAAYGLVSGLLSKAKMPVFFKVLVAQLLGRVMRALIVVFALYALKNGSLGLEQAYAFAVAGIPGMLLQLAFIPLILPKLSAFGKKA